MARRAAGVRADRRGAALRRRRHHAGDLGAVRRRGPEGRRAGAVRLRAAHHRRGADRAVPGAALRHRLHRPRLRADHARVVRPAGAARPLRHRQGARHPRGREPLGGSRLHDRRRAGDLLRDPRGRVPGGDGRGGHVCRHGAFRRLVDPRLLVRRRAALPGAELFRPGRAAAGPAGRDRQPVLPARPRLAALPARGLRHGGDRHRQPGHHLGRLLADPAVDPARLPAQDAHRPHGGGRDRADLPAAGQLDARRGDARRRAGLRLVGRAGRPPTASRSRR